MAYEFKLPDLGEGMAEGEIVRWLVKEGDSLTQDQPMVAAFSAASTEVCTMPPQASRVTDRSDRAAARRINLAWPMGTV